MEHQRTEALCRNCGGPVQGLGVDEEREGGLPLVGLCHSPHSKGVGGQDQKLNVTSKSATVLTMADNLFGFWSYARAIDPGEFSVLHDELEREMADSVEGSFYLWKDTYNIPLGSDFPKEFSRRP